MCINKPVVNETHTQNSHTAQHSTVISNAPKRITKMALFMLQGHQLIH